MPAGESLPFPPLAVCRCGVQLHPSLDTPFPIFGWEGASWAVDAAGIDSTMTFATHAHLDHLPVNLRDNSGKIDNINHKTHPVWTTRLTRSLFAARGVSLPLGPEWILGPGGQFCLSYAPKLQFTGITSGHMEGAASLLVQHVDNSASLFYAGEFYPAQRGSLPGLAPRPCTTLIIESTYGHPDWAHPPPGVAERQLRDLVRDYSARGPVLVSGYAGGKMTRVVEILADLNLPFIVPPEFAREWTVLQDSGEFPIFTNKDPPIAIYTRSQLRGQKGKDTRSRAVYLTTPGSLGTGAGEGELAGAPSILCGGRVLDPAYRTEHPATAYVPLRDHPTYAELLAFVRGCHPEDVWVLPGEEKSLCWVIRHELGIECNPLVMPRPSGIPNLPQLFFS